MTLAFLGIIISLALLITLAYRGHSVIYAGPISAMVAVIFAGAPLLASYTQIFMPAFGRFMIVFFPLFLTGAIFGRLMTLSGYADDLARWISSGLGVQRAILATVVATALLTYGGVSAWVIAFTIYPISVALFKEAGIPKRLMPAAIALGIFTFATAALPGSPQIHNAIAARYFSTTTFAAPVLGIIGAIVTFSLGYAWLVWRQKQLIARGEVFETTLDPVGRQKAEALLEASEQGDDLSGVRHTDSGTILRRGFIGVLPVLTVVLVNAFMTYAVPAMVDFGYLSEAQYGATNINQVIGVWSVIASLVAAIVLIFLMQTHNARTYIEGLSEGAKNSVVPVFSTASEVGYGAVIASLPVFALIKAGLFGISQNPLIVAAVATGGIAGLTGSAAGGLTITLNSIGAELTRMAVEQGISLEILHRVTAMAAVSFDSLPHNGAIITLLVVCGLTHRDSYKDIGVVTVIVPLIGLLVVLGLGLLMN
ncbi:MAG: GntP family permease [Alcaligenaceae bacterium]|nr:GntP family permease [Alcaligenaceae bacterium]